MDIISGEMTQTGEVFVFSFAYRGYSYGKNESQRAKHTFRHVRPTKT